MADLIQSKEDTIDFPDLTGTFPVARKDYRWIDTSRLEIYNQEKTQRQIQVKIYFPATGPKKSGHALYDPKAIIPFTKNIPAVNNYVIRTHAILDVIQVADGQFPVILFSHGLATSLSHYTYLCENIASYGFIVVGIEHLYISGVTPDGESFDIVKIKDENFLGFGHEATNICLMDIQFALTQLENLNTIDSILLGRLDLSKIGMFGHSLGGMNTIIASQKLQEICMGVVLDTPLQPLRICELKKHPNKPLVLLQTKSYMKEQSDDKFRLIISALYVYCLI